MKKITEIVRYGYARLQGGLIVGVVALLASALWHLRVGWPWLWPCGALLIALGVVGLTMLVRRPQAVLWFEDEILHWQEDSFLPFQRGWKGSLPVSDITHLRSTRTPLTGDFFYELVITAADGDQHPLPPNISFLTREQRLTDLLATLRAHKPTITFEEMHVS
jgi:hypothetical protein